MELGCLILSKKSTWEEQMWFEGLSSTPKASRQRKAQAGYPRQKPATVETISPLQHVPALECPPLATLNFAIIGYI